MSSDNSSIDTPVFTVRTLAWLRTSWLKGISRITARVLILVGLAMVQMLHDGRPGATLPILKTRHRSRNGPLPLGWPNRSGPAMPGRHPGGPRRQARGGRQAEYGPTGENPARDDDLDAKMGPGQRVAAVTPVALEL